jgi:hypothetical protein
MADESEARGFVIEGKTYPLPPLASFDMDEAQILWEYCELGIEDFAPDKDGAYTDESIRGLARTMKNPSFRRTLLHVAYRRGNPQATHAEIAAAIGKVSNVDALAAWMDEMEAGQDADPTKEPAPKPAGSSESERDGSNTSSGNGSSTTSTAPDATPVPIGASR